MRINYNVSAMISNNALRNSETALGKSLERLSSGLKLNHAKDNPAGIAMAKRMNAQLQGLSVANQNAANGVSIMETADGALSEMHSILQRMSELALKASTGTMINEDREIINNEVTQLKQELNRIRETTEFNGQSLLNGEFDTKGYTSDNRIKVNSYSENVVRREYILDELKVQTGANGEIINASISFSNGSGFPADARVDSFKDGKIVIKGGGDFELELNLGKLGANANVTYGAPGTPTKIDLTGIGSMRLQVGANEGQVIELKIPDVSLGNMGIEDINVKTEADAQDAIDRIKGAISYVSEVRSRLGAYQNRLDSSIGSLDITEENMTAAYSRIMDVDMAEEMTEYTKYQILTQAGTSMLAQANERPSQVLQLLQ